MKSLKKELFLVASIFTLALSGCGGIDDSSLLASSVNDYSSNSLDKTPNSTALAVSSTNVNYSVPVAQTQVEVTGTCFASTYAAHYIQAKVNGSIIGMVDINTGATNRAQCVNGRFALAINVSGWGTGQYTVVLNMHGYNDASNVLTNDVRGRFEFVVTKY